MSLLPVLVVFFAAAVARLEIITGNPPVSVCPVMYQALRPCAVPCRPGSEVFGKLLQE
jgi:hypothetical protein